MQYDRANAQGRSSCFGRPVQLRRSCRIDATGTNTLTGKDILAIPVLGGEADLIKTLQLLPGTVRGIEGSSDLFVRGGAADQNLVLLDDATIYNTSHLFGFSIRLQSRYA